MIIRENWERVENNILSPYAVLSRKSKGRKIYEEPCDIRTDFQRDRDRIVHSKAFRRLKHKTQVFISPEGDHYRTRLTHTLEVAQIARTLARALKLNEDLTEAIALGHDLGHTPFGHTGEKVLDQICSFGFKHRQQSLRVVDELESGKGLNLTWEVRDGILNHSGSKSPETLEGQIVHFSDRIAYINHDIEDAQRAGIMTESQLPAECVRVLGKGKRQRIDRMIHDIIQNSWGKDYVIMSEEVKNATHQLRNFLFDTVYIGSKAKTEEDKTGNIILSLFNYFTNHPEDMSNECRENLKNEKIERVVTDYIAGMTDRYAVNRYSALFIPSPWRVY
ncbi:deoxyguanosinetriphosphate triphosphohydrolase [Alkalibacter saccharofermentans]|uniref:Deoxyguanosinetriphosphate triphosphohydrolase-like protein n=1 Tax=Alkalibacter saccharofermentans DSM 14828 TaxID=1120975 RepID=A0A1M4Z4C9_9FIRM|nr:deoxyguanosinetriphosphate triphosphohydrolase [Alkalibacter saccharofermentans]SHF12446.1 dGTPase [Alkalibacter saccharofermentans DSM 14828]